MSNSQLVSQIQSAFLNPKVKDEFKTGMEVEVHTKIKEWEKYRIQKFKGIIVKTSGKTPLEKTITVRKKVGPFGVERVFPIHSPSVDQIDILRQFKVRRKYISFIRDLTGKAARLKEVRKETKKVSTPKVEKTQEDTTPHTEKPEKKAPAKKTSTAKKTK